MKLEFPVRTELNLPRQSITLRNLYHDLSNNLIGYIDDGVLLSRSDDLQSAASAVPFWSGSGWKMFDGATYSPAVIKVGSVTLYSSPTSNKFQSLQDKSGVIALLDDVAGISPTVTLQPGATGVDWDVGKNFVCNLTKKTLFTMLHSRPGMEINILVINKGSQWDLIWDDAILWPGVPAPMPHGVAGQTNSALYTIRNLDGTILGENQNQEISWPSA